MEDAIDFTWQGAKANHTVMLCEMERGVLTWEDSDRIDHICRAHAQKHIAPTNSGWSKTGDLNRKPWFCKNYQTGSCSLNKDHDTNRKLHKHICAFSVELVEIQNIKGHIRLYSTRSSWEPMCGVDVA